MGSTREEWERRGRPRADAAAPLRELGVADLHRRHGRCEPRGSRRGLSQSMLGVAQVTVALAPPQEHGVGAAGVLVVLDLGTTQVLDGVAELAGLGRLRA